MCLLLVFRSDYSTYTAWYYELSIISIKNRDVFWLLIISSHKFGVCYARWIVFTYKKNGAAVAKIVADLHFTAGVCIVHIHRYINMKPNRQQALSIVPAVATCTCMYSILYCCIVVSGGVIIIFFCVEGKLEGPIGCYIAWELD